MKQIITPDQLKELSPEQEEKLRTWWKPQYGDFILLPNGQVMAMGNGDIYGWDENKITYFYPDEQKGSDAVLINDCLVLLSIGQCIELLKEKDMNALAQVFWQLAYGIEDGCFDMVDDLIDSLWEAVKSIL